MHKARHRGNAFEVVEVRGWITWLAPGSFNDDPDYHYDIRLDPDNPPRLLTGPRAGDIIPLSLILHPGNLIEPVEEQYHRLPQFRHPDNSDVFVGNNLKIEIHGCATGVQQEEPANRTLCSASTNSPETVPTDWVAADDVDGDPIIFWPFHPRHPLDFQPGVIEEGKYVRLVGTLWEDDPHEFGRCWDDEDEGGHGWYELHPVDFMAMFEDFAPNPPQSTAQVIAACSAGEVDVDLRPPDPQPAGTVPRFEEILRVNEGTTRRFTTHILG